MNKKNIYNDNVTPLAVDITDLQKITGLGRNNAMKLAQEADAVINLGLRRTLYNVERVKIYLDNRTGGAV